LVAANADANFMDLDVSELHKLAERALQEAVNKVIEEARRTDGTLVVWEDGAVKHIRARDLPPTEPPSP
jgi:hypothetical protein